MGRFKKGCAPGPGRPPGPSRDARCAAWAEAFGLEFLFRVAEGRETDKPMEGVTIPASLRLRAEISRYLLDRAWGKPGQAITLTPAPVAGSPEDERARLMASLAERDRLFGVVN